MATKKQDEGAFLAVEALARLATGGQPGKTRRAVAYRPGDSPRHFAAGEVLVVVVDGDRLVIEKLPRRQQQAPAAGIALRFAEIDAAVSQALERQEVAAHEVALPAWSDPERKALVRGGFDLRSLTPEEPNPVIRATVDYTSLVAQSIALGRSRRGNVSRQSDKR